MFDLADVPGFFVFSRKLYALFRFFFTPNPTLLKGLEPLFPPPQPASPLPSPPLFQKARPFTSLSWAWPPPPPHIFLPFCFRAGFLLTPRCCAVFCGGSLGGPPTGNFPLDCDSMGRRCVMSAKRVDSGFLRFPLPKTIVCGLHVVEPHGGMDAI